MDTKRIPLAAALLVLGGTLLLAPAARALSLQPLNLADLVRESNQIVRGSVTTVNEGMDENKRPYTEVQVKVSETIRGAASRTLTFRQFGLQSPQPAVDGHRYLGLVAGMPRYAVGDQVFLFLSPVSSLGYRSTIGLGQGHFILQGGKFRNDLGNAGLFKSVSFGTYTPNAKERSMAETEQGAVTADTFVGLVRSAVAGKWWDGPRPPKSKLGAPVAGATGNPHE